MDCACKTCINICEKCSHLQVAHGVEGCLYQGCICGDSNRSVRKRIFAEVEDKETRKNRFKSWYDRNKVEYNKKRNARKAESKSRFN